MPKLIIKKQIEFWKQKDPKIFQRERETEQDRERRKKCLQNSEEKGFPA